jgi:hypothetical protein
LNARRRGNQAGQNHPSISPTSSRWVRPRSGRL